MKKIVPAKKTNKILLLAFIFCLSRETVFAQTAFVSPVVSSQTGAASNYNAVLVGPETINGGCTEIGQTWNHNFAGTSDKRLMGFTIAATSYYVNNFGALTTILRRNDNSGIINPASCAPPAPIPWHDRQIAFFEGTVDFTANVATIVNSFPSLTLPGSAGYGSINEMNNIFSRGFINSGADNIFNNASGTGAGYNSNANNIERMDLFVSGGVNVTAANMNRVGIVIVCRGMTDDPFTLSAIKGLAGGTNTGVGPGTNYVYDDIIRVDATWANKRTNGGGAVGIPVASKTTLIAGLTSVVLRRMDSDAALDNLLPVGEYPAASSTVPAQNIIGMFFTFADLGLVAGETFYGYSLGAYDGNIATSQQFNSYSDPAFFPLNTNPANGGIDLTGFPGIFSPVDIDDDDDGIPDYIEANLPLATGDLDLDGTPNWNDADYPGFVDNNADGVNDNFDPSADSDNDLTPNYRDNGFPAYIDSNGDLINDNFDKDLDGIPNHLDKDSDNDGIPDVVEADGVDQDGDGKIDNYTDTDVDGLSQNADGSNIGVVGSGNGLGTPDLDGDLIPNYCDLDSDNDGIPDIIEVFGTDANNNGRIDGFTDTDGDGYSDNVDGDVGNDGTAENAASTLLRTGADGNNDGRADSYPYKNMDADSKANPYDPDSDGDGITDVKEAGFADVDNNGIIDGAFNTNGWSVVVAALPSINLPNTDASGLVNVYDIDSDDDGIPDNIEGQATAAYLLPSGTDSDNDGLDNSYDNTVGFSGNGIPPLDTDGDGSPDYRDSDTDGDGALDIFEGNDYNNNGLVDDGVALSGTDTDGDGLDDFFDLLSTTKGTSANMGNGGSFTGDPSPGTTATVQQNGVFGCASQRDWRCISYVLNCNILTFKGALQNRKVQLDWEALCDQEADHFIVERSVDGSTFQYLDLVKVGANADRRSSFRYVDDISFVEPAVIYYRIKTVTAQGKTSYSSVISVQQNESYGQSVQIKPNPVVGSLKVTLTTNTVLRAIIQVYNGNGKMILNTSSNILAGSNSVILSETERYPAGIYYLRVNLGGEIITRKFTVLK